MREWRPEHFNDGVSIALGMSLDAFFKALRPDVGRLDWMLGYPAFPVNLVHISLAQHDPKMLTSTDGKTVQVRLETVAALLRECAKQR